MASAYAVAIAAILQIVFRISFFIEQNNDLCSTAPTLASWIFLIAFLDILLDICIYPIRYMNLPFICQIIAETVVTILLTEFGSLVIWCTIEKLTCKLCKSTILLVGVSPEIYFKWESVILGVITTTTSLIILVFVGQATDHYHFLHKKSLRMCRKVNSNVTELWRKLRNVRVNKKSCNMDSMAECLNILEQEECDSPILCQPRRNNTNKKRNRRQSRSRSRSRRRC